MIRDCVCSGDDKSRLISCQLKRYCKLNGKYIKLNEQEVIETETQEKIEILQTTTGTKTDCHHMGHMIWPIIWTPYRMDPMLEFWFCIETNLYLYWSCSYILYHRSKTNYKEKPIPGRKTLRLVKAWEKKCMQYASSMKNTRFWVRVSGTIGPVCPCFAWPWNDLAMTFDWSFSIFKTP